MHVDGSTVFAWVTEIVCEETGEVSTEKNFFIPYDSEVSHAHVVARDYGTMTFAAGRLDALEDEENSFTVFEDVPLEPGREFITFLDEDVEEVQLFFKIDGEIVGEVLPDGEEVVFTTGVTIAEPTSSLMFNQQYQLSATVTPIGANQAITWSSSQPFVATVNDDGLVTAQWRLGTTIITATTACGNHTAQATITVDNVVHTWQQLRDAIEESMWRIYIGSDIIAEDAIVIPAGHHITLTSNADARVLMQTNHGQRHFIVHGSLTLDEGIILSGGTTNNTNNSGGVDVYADAWFIMNEGSMIENNRRTIPGGAVSLMGNDTEQALFGMVGGVIRNNRASYGGGVNVGENSYMIMVDGLIQNNANTSTTTTINTGGGGVRLHTESSLFDMHGGTIEGNTSTRHGGGVLVSSGAVFMKYGGTIRGNAAAQNGGGVAVTSLNPENETTFGLFDGIIEHNTAINGGGVSASRADNNLAGALFGILDGTIRNNTATVNGGGVHVANASTFITYNGTLASNHAARGGGIFFNDATATFNGGTVNSNTAAISAAAIQLQGNTRAYVYAVDVFDHADESGNYHYGVQVIPPAEIIMQEYEPEAMGVQELDRIFTSRTRGNSRITQIEHTEQAFDG
jgi:hypothetical protein